MPTLTATNQLANADFRFWKVDVTSTDTSVVYTNIFGTSGTLYAIYVQNVESSNEAVFLKMYDTVTAPTNGTTHPDFGFGIKSGVKEVFLFPEGVTFSAGLSWAVSDFANGKGTTRGDSTLDAGVSKIVFVYK